MMMMVKKCTVPKKQSEVIRGFIGGGILVKATFSFLHLLWYLELIPILGTTENLQEEWVRDGRNQSEMRTGQYRAGAVFALHMLFVLCL